MQTRERVSEEKKRRHEAQKAAVKFGILRGGTHNLKGPLLLLPAALAKDGLEARAQHTDVGGELHVVVVVVDGGNAGDLDGDGGADWVQVLSIRH